MSGVVTLCTPLQRRPCAKLIMTAASAISLLLLSSTVEIKRCIFMVFKALEGLMVEEAQDAGGLARP